MKFKILISLFIGIVLCVNMTYKPLIETEIKPPDAPKTHLRHKVNIYIPPTGKTLKIAEKVSKETGVPCETISKIMYFESSYNPKIVGVNKNKTRDIGLFQINSIHLAEAKKMGLNLKDPDDNATFAIHLIKQNGLRDWYSSKKNWES